MPKYDNTPRGRSFFRSSYFEQSTFSKIFEALFYLGLPALVIVGLIIAIVANYI
jgi:hypothetical protein